MATLSNGSFVFIEDIVTVGDHLYGKIKKISVEVSAVHIILHPDRAQIAIGEN